MKGWGELHEDLYEIMYELYFSYSPEDVVHSIRLVTNDLPLSTDEWRELKEKMDKMVTNWENE